MTDTVADFCLSIEPDQLTVPVREMARALLLDLVGVAAAGSKTHLSRIVRDHAVAQFGGTEPLLFDGRPASPAGVALAGAFTIDSMDAHDGYRPAKGHAGCAALPAVLATAENGLSGAEFLTRLVLGYEIGCRAGTVLHGTAADYHTSGAWMALATAAIAGRALGLDAEHVREAIGIAEYHGPRSPMMRCIDHPTMVKDGSGWGAMAGVSAAYLARAGFTGAPADLTSAMPEHWADLGERWLILEQYVKPEPVCRWAQPPIHAAAALMKKHDIDPASIVAIEVRSFTEAIRLNVRCPATTEQAQYSLPYSLASALVNGRVGPAEVDGLALSDPRVLRLANIMVLKEHAPFSKRFPARRFAELDIETRDGRRFQSGPTEASGDPETPLSDSQMRAKFHQFADEPLGIERSERIEACIDSLWGEQSQEMLQELRDPTY